MTDLTEHQIWSLERLGRLLISSDRRVDARAMFEGITRVAPQRSYAWYALARLEAESGSESRALDYSVHAMRLEASARNRLLCAELHLKAGDHETAAEALTGLAELPAGPERDRAIVLKRRWFGG